MKNKTSNKKTSLNDLPKKQKLLIFLLFLLPTTSICTSINSDAYFMLSSGRYILSNSVIPCTDVLTIHTGMPSIMQQWLTDVIYFFLYSHLGTAGLIIFVFIIYFSIVFALYKIGILIGNNHTISILIITVGMFFICKSFMTTRPQVTTYLAIILEILVLENYVHKKNWRYLCFLPLISIAEINLNAAMWPILLVILLPYIADSLKINFWFIKCDKNCKFISLLLAFIVVLLSGFVNPYGIKAMTYLFTSYGYDSVNNFMGEMFPISVNNYEGKVFIFGIVLTAIILIVHKSGELKLRYTLFLLGFGYLAMSSIRSYPLFIIAAIISLSYYLKDIQIKVSYKDNKDLRNQFIACTLIFAIIIGAGKYINTFSNNEYADFGADAVCDFIEENYDTDDVIAFNSFDIGGYLEFRGIKPYIDPRIELYLESNNKEKDFIVEYNDAQSGAINYKDFIDKYKFNMFILYNYESFGKYLKNDSNYKLVYKDETFSVYVPA